MSIFRLLARPNRKGAGNAGEAGEDTSEEKVYAVVFYKATRLSAA